MMGIEDLSRLIKQKNREVAELKQSVLSRLEIDLAESTTLDRKTYDEIQFFLNIDDTVDLGFIVSCLCEPGYWEDFYLDHCPASFMSYVERFCSLLQSLKARYIDCWLNWWNAILILTNRKISGKNQRISIHWFCFLNISVYLFSIYIKNILIIHYWLNNWLKLKGSTVSGIP